MSAALDDSEGWESHLVHFRDFESLPTEKGRTVESPKFNLCDREWELRLYPGGADWPGSEAKDGMVSLYIHKLSDITISAKFAFKVKPTANENDFPRKESTFHVFDGPGTNTWGWKDFIKRERITDPTSTILNNGTFAIEVFVKLDNQYCKNFIPRNAFAQNMLRSFMDEDTSDIVFNVKGQDTAFHAHKVVLQFCAQGSTLASFCEEYDKSTSIPILDVDSGVFRQMLYYVYGGKIDSTEWTEKSKDFIDAADRYGLKNLKIEAEAWYVYHLKLTVDTVVEELVYADKMNCFLLQETAMDFVLKNSKEVLALDTFDQIPQSTSIIREIVSVAAMATNNKADDKKDPDDLTELSINELRAKLCKEGKDIDGPRNALVSQLKSTMKKTS